MSRASRGESQEFCAVLKDLAADEAGWQGPAGEAFAALMTQVLERRSARIRADVGDVGVMVDPSDVVSEAVMVVDGPEGVTLAESARRILAMDRPLGYVVSAVTANTSRAVLSEQMGVGARQVQPGVAPVSHYAAVSGESGDEYLDRHRARTAWATAPASGGNAPAPVSRQFVGVLVGRFHARPEAVMRSLEVATDVALARDAGVGLTNATSRRRLALFCAQARDLARVGMDRRQTQAMARLLFGTERHPEWSLLAECARSVESTEAISVTAWQARHARELGSRRTGARLKVAPTQQPALFSDELDARRSRSMRRSA